MIQILKIGSRGPLVEDLQRALNATLRPSPNLRPDGVFGPRTEQAVKTFQRREWLVADGDVGPCTHNALYGHETYPPILHRITLIPQPTDNTCWAASTAMMTNSTVKAVIDRTPKDMYTVMTGTPATVKDTDLFRRPVGLFNFSDTDDAVTSGRRFASIHGLRFNPPQSWMVSALRSALQRGPLMFDMLWKADEYVKGIGSPGHMIVVAGIRGDNDQSGAGTTLRIYDPWRPGRGNKYSVGYKRWINEVPTRTYRVFER